MRDPVNAVLLDRAALERGFLESMIVSGLGHALVVGIAVAITLLSPREPLIKVMPGFMISLPPGGAGSPVAAPAAPAPAPPVTQAAAPKVEPPPQILKPVQELPRKGIADIDEKPSSKKPPKPQPVQVSGSGAASPGANATPGFALGPPGAGVPGGTDPFGDWYLAGVQRKIWMVWAQQVKAGMTQPAMVSFTILADGSVTDVHLVQQSGVYLLDNAAQRAILSSAPFGPLPKDYGTNRITIQGIFKPGE